MPSRSRSLIAFLVLLSWVLPVAGLLVSPAALAAAAPDRPTILVVGDSLSAGFGLDAEAGWVHLLQQRLAAAGYPHRVANASLSGDTTAGGLARLPAALDRNRPAIVLIELGGNDGLRGLPLKAMRDNLGALVRRAQDTGARVLLFEIQIPPNYGAAYTRGFKDSFAQVAQATGVTLVPFFLAGIVGQPGAFLDDGIHPSASAQPALVDAVWPSLQPLLRR